MDQEPNSLDKLIEELMKKPEYWWLSSSSDKPAQPETNLFANEKPEIDYRELGKWLNIVKHPATVVIVGARNSGKSALGYKLLEYLRYNAKPCVVALPKKARMYVPDWIGNMPSVADIPPGSVALIDESYILFHSRASSLQRSEVLSNLINLSRHRDQTLIFVSQEGRQIDVNIVSTASIIVFKNPGILQLDFERKQLKRIAEKAQQTFAAIDSKEKNRWSYVHAPESGFIGMLENSLPSFWTSSLSKAYSDNTPSDKVTIPSKMTREEKINMARNLRRHGFSLGEIAKILGVAKSTVKNYLDGYPYRRKRKY